MIIWPLNACRPNLCPGPTRHDWRARIAHLLGLDITRPPPRPPTERNRKIILTPFLIVKIHAKSVLTGLTHCNLAVRGPWHHESPVFMGLDEWVVMDRRWFWFGESGFEAVIGTGG